MAQKLHLNIDQETFERLAEIAIAERRPIGWQAELLLTTAVAQWWTPSLQDYQSEGEPAGVQD